MSADETNLENESKQHKISPNVETEDDEETRQCIDTDRFALGEEEDDDEKAPEFKEKWSEMFDRLEAFKEKHGHCLVPNRYPEDPQLGSWVSTQRRQYKVLTSGSAESTPMTPKRAAMLQEIGFTWTTTDPRHVPWAVRYNELVDFVTEFGHAQVPIGWKRNVPLSNWVSTQRQEFKLLQKGRTSRLSEERLDQLNKVGFVWEAQRGGPRRKLRATVLVPDQAKPVEGTGPRSQPSISRRGGLSRGGTILNRPLSSGQSLSVGVPTLGGVSMLGGFNSIPQAAPTGVSYQLQVVAVPTYAGFQSPPVAMAPAVSIAPSIFPMAQPVLQPLIQPISQPMVQPAYPLQPPQAVAQMNAVPQPNQLSPYHSQSIPALKAPPSDAGDFFLEEQPRKRRRSQGSA